MKYILILTGLLFSLPQAQSQNYYNYNTQSGSGNVQEGNAVYYADYMHGKRTALGEVYRMEEFTAAHKTLPKGALVRVTRLDSGQSVVVRINDRGPFDPDVIIDLSKAAAMKIGLVKKGRARVRLETIGQSNSNPGNGTLNGASPNPYSNTAYAPKGAPAAQTYSQPAPSAYNYRSAQPPASNSYSNVGTRGGTAYYSTLPPTANGYAIQLASYSNLDNARNQLQRLQQHGMQNLYIWQRDGYYKILIASFASKKSAAAYLEQLRSQKLQDGIVIKIK